MMDIVCPGKDAEGFSKMARLLGVGGLGAMDADVAGMTRISGGAGAGALRIGFGKDKARAHLEDRRFDAIADIEEHRQREHLHQRNSGLNHVLAKIAHDKDKIVVFDVRLLLCSGGQRRALLLARMRQNVMLCRRFKAQMALASFATSPFEMKGPREMIAIGELVGMTAAEAKEATLALGKRIAKKAQSL